MNRPRKLRSIALLVLAVGFVACVAAVAAHAATKDDMQHPDHVLPPSAGVPQSSDGQKLAPLLQISQQATSGSLVPTGFRSAFTLRITGVGANAQWFEGNPGTHRGGVAQAVVLQDLFSAPDNPPPNATLTFVRTDGTMAVLGMHLLSGTYDARRRALTYRVQLLHNTPLGTKGPHVRAPKRFGAASLQVNNVCLACVGPIEAGKNLARDVARDALFAINDFTGLHACTGGIVNQTSGNLTWAWDDYARYDSWGVMPPRMVEPGKLVSWNTKADLYRGCWNYVSYQGAQGTVGVGVDGPYPGNGPNDWACQPGGAYTCTLMNLTMSKGSHVWAFYCIADQVPANQAKCTELANQT